MPPSEFIIAEIAKVEKYLEKIVDLNREIFQDRFPQPYGIEEYRRRIENENSLVLALLNKWPDDDKVFGDLIAFPKDSSFYIWLAGVDERIRRQGLGSDLLFYCERFAQKRGFSSVLTKTYNVSPEMQRLLLRKDYLITGFEEDPENPENNIVHFSLNLEGRDYRTGKEKFDEAKRLVEEERGKEE